MGLWTKVLLGMFVLTAFFMVAGCGGPPSHLETVVTYSELAIDATDDVLSERLDRAITETENLSQAIANERLEPLLGGAAILERADSAARAARLALDTWDDSARVRGQQLVSCLVLRIAELIPLMEELGVPVPEYLLTVTKYADTFLGPICVSD